MSVTALQSGWTAARAEQTNLERFGKGVPDHAAFWFSPFAVETRGYMRKDMRKDVVRCVNRNRLRDGKGPSGWAHSLG